MNIKLRVVLAFFLFTIPLAIYADPKSDDSVRENAELRQLLEETGFDGTILIYDPAAEEWTTANRAEVDERRIPASTFKIFSSLAALETGVVESPSSVIRWDGVERSRKSLNRDHDLRSAFQVSALPHYQQMVREIGIERMQGFLDEVGYGNRDSSGEVDLFWLTGGLRISPREQIEFLIRLKSGGLPFSPKTQASVRELMVSEETDEYVVSAKTGWAIPDDERHVGWWVGWVEKGSSTYFFATVLTTEQSDAAFGKTRISVTRDALELLGIL